MFSGVHPDVPGDPKNHENIVDYSTFQNPARRAAGQKQTGRKTAVPAYVLDPWRVNTPEHSKAIYGKVLPIHIERNKARSDGLAD